MRYHTILADPPWPQAMIGKWKQRKNMRPDDLPYPTMAVDQIAAMPVQDLAAEACHLWLWTTNQFLEAGFEVMRAWGFTYLAPIHWIKPSGMGAWWVHRTQTVLFGYYHKCRFPLARYLPNFFEANPAKHSQKPPESYELVETISPIQRLELFARTTRPGWHVWGNEVTPHPNTINTLGSPAPNHERKES